MKIIVNQVLMKKKDKYMIVENNLAKQSKLLVMNRKIIMEMLIMIKYGKND